MKYLALLVALLPISSFADDEKTKKDGDEKKPSEIFEFLSGLSIYLVVKGDVIKDGGTEDEEVKTEYTDSKIGLAGKVIRIDF